MTGSVSRKAGAKVYLRAAGHFHPPHEISNEFLTSLDNGSDPTWVVERTGIEKRRSVLAPEILTRLRRGAVTLAELRDQNQLMPLHEMAAHAWDNLLVRCGALTRPPDTVICGTSVPDFDIPANACSIAGRLGWDAVAFDVNSACSSFVVDLHVASSLVSQKSSQTVAIFNPERYSLRLDYADRATCVLFGDGCAATLLQNTPNPGSLELIDTIISSAPIKYDVVRIPVGGYFTQDGRAVQKFAITRTIETTFSLLERNGLTTSDINYFIGHQANLRMLTSAAEKMGFSGQQHLYNVKDFGNQGAAGAPCVLSMNWEKFRPDDLIVVSVVGSGLTWGSALFRAI